MRLLSTSHSPSLLPSPPPHLPPAAAAAAALRRARTPQCKDCSSITIWARQGLVFRGQRAKFSDGYIVQVDSLLAQASPHVSNSSSVHQLNTASAPYTPTLSHIFSACEPHPACVCSVSAPACAWVVTLATACPENLVSARKCLNAGVSIWRYGAENGARETFVPPKAVFAAPNKPSSHKVD